MATIKWLKTVEGRVSPADPLRVTIGTGGVAASSLAQAGTAGDAGKIVAAAAGVTSTSRSLFLVDEAEIATAVATVYPALPGDVLEATYSTGTPAMLDEVELVSPTTVKKGLGTNPNIGRVIRLVNPSTGLDETSPAASTIVHIMLY